MDGIWKCLIKRPGFQEGISGKRKGTTVTVTLFDEQDMFLSGLVNTTSG